MDSESEPNMVKQGKMRKKPAKSQILPWLLLPFLIGLIPLVAYIAFEAVMYWIASLDRRGRDVRDVVDLASYILIAVAIASFFTVCLCRIRAYVRVFLILYIFAACAGATFALMACLFLKALSH